MPGCKIKRATGCTEADALSALSTEVWHIPPDAFLEVLAQIQSWERVMVLVRNQDAVAEVEVAGNAGYLNNNWLNWIEAGLNLHIRVAATRQILALVRQGKRGPTYSFNLVNRQGQVFCRFYARTAAAQAGFLDFCRNLC